MEVYQEVFRSFPNHREDIYFARPITTGPLKELIAKFGLTWPQKLSLIIDTNNLIAEAAAKEVERLFAGKPIILPPSRAKFESELDGITFCLFVLSGLNPQSAEKFYSDLTKGKIVKVNIFNDHQKSREQRGQEYEKLADYFVQFLKSESTNPTSLMILLPGYDKSLGCNVEKKLAESLEVPLKEAVFDENHPEFREKIIEKILQPLLRDRSTKRIIQALNFSFPAIAGGGKNLVVLRDFQG